MLIKLTKAIELLRGLELPLKTAQDHDNHLAVKLGIKALERIQGLRSAGHYIGMPLLKDEQPEEITKKEVVNGIL